METCSQCEYYLKCGICEYNECYTRPDFKACDAYTEKEEEK